MELEKSKNRLGFFCPDPDFNWIDATSYAIGDILVGIGEGSFRTKVNTAIRCAEFMGYQLGIANNKTVIEDKDKEIETLKARLNAFETRMKVAHEADWYQINTILAKQNEENLPVD